MNTDFSEYIVRADATHASNIRQLHIALCADLYPNNTDYWIDSREGVRYLDSRLSGDGLALIAIASGKAVAYLMAGVRLLDGEPAAGLESIYSVPEARGKGLGMALIKRFLEWFNESDVQIASVAVAPKNQDAHRLYRRAGFADHALIDNGDTLVLTMRKSSGHK